MRRPWIGVALVVAVVAALAVQTGVVVRTGFTMGDFRAFYCAARVASHGANPYHTEPLRTCELGIGSTMFFEKNPGVTIPAPLPGYAIAALVPLSLLPFAAAATLWSLLLILAWLACIATLSRFARVSWEIALAVFGLSLGLVSLPLGEVVPLALACICLAAYYAWQGRWGAAIVAALGTMIEPHLGLPVCLAIAIWKPATRVPFAFAFGALAALSFALLGVATNVEYFTSVLPAHALSELSRDTQFSLTAALAGAGVAPATALRAGSIWYAIMVIVGVALAGILAKRTRNTAFIVCVPPAFAVFGGTFIHITQIAAALPAAVLLVNYSNRAQRTFAVVALLLLTVPWVWSYSPALIVAPLVPAGYLAWRYWNDSLVAGLLAGLAAGAAILGLSTLVSAAPHSAAHAPPVIDPQLAEATWSAFTQQSSTNGFVTWMLRLPTWFGLGLLLVLLVREAALRVRVRDLPALALAAVCTLLPIGAQFFGDAAGSRLGIDFRAYYCAASAQRAGENPYLAQSLHDCEQRAAAPYYRAPANVTVPAPYPPYALALLYPFTFVPFGAAMVAWWIALALAMLLAAYALARIAKQPFPIAWAALGLALGLTSFTSGNLVSFGFAAVMIAVLFAVRGRPLLASAAMALAMVEPNIALPAAVGMFAVYPATRLALSVAAVALAGLSVACVGAAQTLSYVTAVLPAHALSEVSRDNQYSLASVVAAIGVPDASAALIGSLSYVAMIALGTIVGLRLARRYNDRSLAILLPMGLALLGGSFVHTGEIAAAIPACLVIFTRAREHRGWMLAALILLAVPWMMATSIAIFLAPIFPVAYLTYALWTKERATVLGVAVAAFAILLGLFAVSAAMPPHPSAIPPTHAWIDPRLAEASWRDFVLGNSTNRPIMWLLRGPSWIALAVLAVTATLIAKKPTTSRSVQSSSALTSDLAVL